MSTHAVIGILKDNILDNVYVHSDGDLSWTGRMLLEHYNTAEKANALIQLGGPVHHQGAAGPKRRRAARLRI